MDSAFFSARPTRPLVFVKEFCTFAHNFDNSSVDVAAIDVSTCHLLEISNRKEGGHRTAFSLSHFTFSQLDKEPSILIESIDIILNNFIRVGGNLETAEFRLFGGVCHRSTRQALRRNFNTALHTKLPSIEVKEPHEHWMTFERAVTDYIFSQNSVSWRKCDLRTDDTSNDVYSKAYNTKSKKKELSDRIDSYLSVSDALDQQTQNRNLLSNFLPQKLRMEMVKEDGLISDNTSVSSFVRQNT